MDTYLNLSGIELTEHQKKFLDLGPKCHIKPKYDPLKKQVETEILYASLIDLESKDKIEINSNLKPQLIAESTKCRDKKSSRILTPELRNAASELKNHKDIIVRRADKANNYVIIKRYEYNGKLDAILSDTTKFKRITRNPIKELIVDVNRMIKQVNGSNESKILKPIVGEYKPGYLYGTVKTHKPGNPLRPIVSQIPTPTYETSKCLNKLIMPYLPAKYQLNSTDEFIEILKTTEAQGVLASLDVESLFTNVPISETIEIICDCVYRNDEIAPLPIPEATLKKLLEACTTRCPFLHQDKLYLQCDGVSMGSPLGVTFANFYMTHVENKVMNNPLLKPRCYARFVDDCFTISETPQSVAPLIEAFERNSVLRFTYEMGNKQLNFLDVNVRMNNSTTFEFKPYRKPTDPGVYLNPTSECPERYKDGTISALIHRTFKSSSTGSAFQQAIKNLKQLFVNNGYSNSRFDSVLNKYM